MIKHNLDETKTKFNRFWKNNDAVHIMVADVERPEPIFILHGIGCKT